MLALSFILFVMICVVAGAIGAMPTWGAIRKSMLADAHDKIRARDREISDLKQRLRWALGESDKAPHADPFRNDAGKQRD